jgi:hypothetical protein
MINIEEKNTRPQCVKIFIYGKPGYVAAYVD